MKSLGKTKILIKNERKQRLQIYIKQKHIRIIEKLAEKNNQSKSKVASDIIEQYLQKQEETPIE